MSYKIFEKNPVKPVHWSNHNLSNEVKMSFDMGYIVPVGAPLECLPNDRISGNTEAYIQFAPMVYPIFHRLNCKIYHFFVPMRILWKYWKKFIYEQKNEDNIPPKPTFNLEHLLKSGSIGSGDPSGRNGCGSLADYLGFPVQNFIEFNSAYVDPYLDHPSFQFDALPFAAYQLIYNEYFRDENLEPNMFDEDDEAGLETGNLYLEVFEHKGTLHEDISNLFTLRKKAWEKDYFTSALPSPQYGDPVPVIINSSNNFIGDLTAIQVSPLDHETPLSTIGLVGSNENPTLNPQDFRINPYDLNDGDIAHDPSLQFQGYKFNLGSLYFTISDLRAASSLQRMYEALARGGHRYKEAIISFYNQITPDYRLDRPEFIGASTIPVRISSVEQTSETGSTPQGSLAGRAVSYGSNNSFRYHCQEHGYLFTLACVLPRTAYANGLNKIWSRLDRYDYHNPEFENLGDQAIKSKELYLNSDVRELDLNEETFGYAPRYSEYKYRPSTCHGEFLANLDFMTMTRFFGAQPYLNSNFIRVDQETVNRPFAVQDDSAHKLYAQFYNKIFARRPMQNNPIPKLL